MNTYLVTYCEMGSNGELNGATSYVLAKSKVSALMAVVNMSTTAVYSVSSVEKVAAVYHDRDLTPAQAEALDAAAARPPVKIKARDLPSRKRKGKE